MLFEKKSEINLFYFSIFENNLNYLEIKLKNMGRNNKFGMTIGLMSLWSFKLQKYKV